MRQPSLIGLRRRKPAVCHVGSVVPAMTRIRWRYALRVRLACRLPAAPLLFIFIVCNHRFDESPVNGPAMRAKSSALALAMHCRPPNRHHVVTAVPTINLPGLMENHLMKFPWPDRARNGGHLPLGRAVSFLQSIGEPERGRGRLNDHATTRSRRTTRMTLRTRVSVIVSNTPSKRIDCLCFLLLSVAFGEEERERPRPSSSPTISSSSGNGMAEQDQLPEPARSESLSLPPVHATGSVRTEGFYRLAKRQAAPKSPKQGFAADAKRDQNQEPDDTADVLSSRRSDRADRRRFCAGSNLSCRSPFRLLTSW